MLTAHHQRSSHKFITLDLTVAFCFRALTPLYNEESFIHECELQSFLFFLLLGHDVNKKRLYTEHSTLQT